MFWLQSTSLSPDFGAFTEEEDGVVAHIEGRRDYQENQPEPQEKKDL